MDASVVEWDLAKFDSLVNREVHERRDPASIELYKSIVGKCILRKRYVKRADIEEWILLLRARLHLHWTKLLHHDSKSYSALAWHGWWSDNLVDDTCIEYVAHILVFTYAFNVLHEFGNGKSLELVLYAVNCNKYRKPWWTEGTSQCSSIFGETRRNSQFQDIWARIWHYFWIEWNVIFSNCVWHINFHILFGFQKMGWSSQGKKSAHLVTYLTSFYDDMVCYCLMDFHMAALSS